MATSPNVFDQFDSGNPFDQFDTHHNVSQPINPAQGYPNTLQVWNPFGQNLDTGISIGQDTANFLAGAGKATEDLARGAGQALGLVSRRDVANSRALDAPLMATRAGKYGFLGGTISDLLPTGFIPGANTLAGAAAIGAGLGFLQPSTSTGETLINTGLGGLAAPASILAGRGIGAAYKGGKALLAPLFRGGQKDIAAQTLQSFAGGSQAAADAANAISNSGEILPGIQPTTAELAGNPGLAQLERTLRNNPEYLSAFTNRNQGNRAAMTTALGNIAGTDADLAAAQSARSASTAPLYQAASNAQVSGDAALNALMERPSMQSAWRRAQQLASERGQPLVSGQDIPEHVVNSSILDSSGKPFSETVPAQAQKYSGRAIQYLKMGLNDIANTAEQKGMGAHESGAVKSSLAALNDWIRANVPALRAADDAFADLSKPINQMEVGQALSNRLQPALSDFGNNTRLSANSFANSVRNGDALASRVTGQQGSTLEGVLSADQLKTVMQVGQQLARRTNADELGRAVGSNTAQNLISQNTLRQILGPLGLPQSMMERAAQSAFGQTVLRPMQWMTKAGEPKVMDILTESALNPALANRLLMQGVDPGFAGLIWARQGLLAPIGQSIAETAKQ